MADLHPADHDASAASGPGPGTGPGPGPGAGPVNTSVSALEARLTDLGRQENERVAEHRRKLEDFKLRGERLLRDVPPAFFALCAGLREATARFNAEITESDPGLPVRYEETVGVTLRDIEADDLRVSVSRKFARFEIRLRLMSRAGKPPVPIIEGDGSYGAEHPRKVLMRIEGWVENGKTIYWYSLDFKRRNIDLAELPARIVMSIVQTDPMPLSRLRQDPGPQVAPGNANDNDNANANASDDVSGKARADAGAPGERAASAKPR